MQKKSWNHYSRKKYEISLSPKLKVKLCSKFFLENDTKGANRGMKNFQKKLFWGS